MNKKTENKAENKKVAARAEKTAPAPSPRILEKYRNETIPLLKEEFSYRNIMEVPKLKKVVVNMGVKEGQEDIKVIEQLSHELAQITGQKPLMTRAKKSISAFKLRQGSPIGLKVTLRRRRMFEFIERLFNVAMPRIRDFRGYSENAFDQTGNYTLGLQEHTVFPEVEFDKVKKIKGMDITFVTTAKNSKEGRRLLELLGLPFKKGSF